MAAHKSRSVLQMVGIILGVGSVVATFGLIDGGRRQGQKFWEKTGGIKKMFIRELDAREMKQNAQREEVEGPHLRRRARAQGPGHDARARRAHHGAAASS